MSRAHAAIAWFVRPFGPGGRALGRAGRIYLLTALMVATVLPGMILRYGIDDWLWHITASVVFFAPLGIFAFDHAAHWMERRRGIALGVWLRACLWLIGLAVGVFVGYAVPVLFPIFPTPDVETLVRDYRRNMTIVTVVLVAAGVVAAVLWYRAETFRLESAVATASFNVLRDQMQPHFLFNALNSLKELIADDPERAGAVTQRIADLYRMIMHVSREPTAPLAEELAVVSSYLEVERVRYGERLRYEIDAAPELAQIHVPSLMVQTLVENAVKHGVCKARDGGEVRVRVARLPDGPVEIAVTNTGAPYAPTEPVRGAGLANTRARLELMYGAASQFSIASDGALTRARFVVTGAKVG